MSSGRLQTGILAATLLLMAGCGDDDGSGDLTSLDGTSWTLVAGSGVTFPNDVALTIQFDGGTASGSGGCNRFTGSYEEDGNSLSLGRVASTRMACPEEIMDAENAYLSVLESVSSWSATDSELVLSDSSGQELLRYDAANA